MDYNSNRYNETFEYVRVDWNNWQEHETYNYITDGSIEQSEESELKITGSFSFEGYDLPNTSDLVRVYYSFQDDNGEWERRPIATLFVSYASKTLEDTIEGVKSSGSLDGMSVLSVLQNKIVGRPYTIPKNTNAVYKAIEICKECGLNVNAEQGNFIVAKDYTFDSSSTLLEVVNWLLTSAGFCEAYPDPMGTVQMISKITKDNTDTVFTFKNDERSIVLPDIEQKNDWQTTPNVVKLLYNVDDVCIIGEARNLSGAKSSLDQRGNREITYFEEISELGDGSRLNNMSKLAEQKIRELSADVEYVTLKHALVPMNIFDRIELDYSDYSWIGEITNMNIDLSPATETQTQITRTNSNDIKVKVLEPQVLRGQA